MCPNNLAASLFPEIVPIPTYPGRKGASGQWQKIVSSIPKCKTFVECMCGSAYIASIVAKTGCKVVINDIDRSVIDKHNYAAGKNIIKMNQDYAICVAANKNQPDPVFFFDPPYMKETRSYQGDIYNYEWDTAAHQRFLYFVQRLKFPVMISHYPCDIYDFTLKKWRRIIYKAMTRAGVRDECLYMNFEQPILLQCYKHVGKNFTDRQRIKRKVDSLIGKLRRENDQERAAILSAVIEKFDYVRK
jgi:DNA adenine methylase